MRIEFEDGRDSVLALLDTGFNGELMMSNLDAVRLGVVLQQSKRTVEVAGGRHVDVQRGLLPIRWLGRLRRTEVFVTNAPSPVRPDDPVALLGTKLLTPNLLLVDFQSNTVEVEEQD